MTDKWEGKIAVVTGTSAGIGAAIFKDFARNGLTVIGFARRVEKIEKIIEELGDVKGKAFAYKCDVSNPESVKEAFKWVEEKFKIVHILVNNVGCGISANILDDNEDTFDRLKKVVDTNFMSYVQCSREAYKLMQKSNDYGMIININSVAGHRVPSVEYSLNIYPSTKFAITALNEVLRQEFILMNNKKIRVTSISPGFVNTEAVANLEEATELLNSAPYLDPEDISHTVMYLLSTSYNVNITELTVQPVGEKF